VLGLILNLHSAVALADVFMTTLYRQLHDNIPGVS